MTQATEARMAACKIVRLSMHENQPRLTGQRERENNKRPLFVEFKARRQRQRQPVSGKSKSKYMSRYEEIRTYQSISFLGGKYGSVIVYNLLGES